MHLLWTEFLIILRWPCVADRMLKSNYWLFQTDQNVSEARIAKQPLKFHESETFSTRSHLLVFCSSREHPGCHAYRIAPFSYFLRSTTMCSAWTLRRASHLWSFPTTWQRTHGRRPRPSCTATTWASCSWTRWPTSLWTTPRGSL